MNPDGKKKGFNKSVVMVSSSVTKCFPLLDLEPNSHQTGRYVHVAYRLLCVHVLECVCVCVKSAGRCRVRGGAKCIFYAKCGAPQSHPSTSAQTQITVSITHAHSQDYATVNPSVLPWQWAGGKEGEEGKGSGHYWSWNCKSLFPLGVTRICHQL